MAEEKKQIDLEGVHVQDDGSKGEIRKTKINIEMPSLPKSLSFQEKSYLLSVERGDTPNVRRILQKAYQKKHIDIDCMDSMGRGALNMAIENENLEMVELLIVMGVSTKDSLLHAINEEFVEAVDLLLQHEELIHKEGEPHSWEQVDRTIATFALDITPLALAAHRNNFEIIKILLDRGATLPMPHDTKCGCDECIEATREDSLRHSLARVNSYRALASPSLIALSSNDPILTAFELSWELRNLAFTEQECKSEYLELRRQCQKFAVDLLSHTRGSKELAIILNHDPDAPPYEDGEHMKLARLELAIDYKQKKFVAHPNIQQLLAALWYEGVPGFRRLSASQKFLEILKVAVLFPVYCMLYMIAPNCKAGKLIRKPFMKFLIHASSYLFFLLLLILVSQRAEVLFIQILGTENMKALLTEQLKQQRGNGPTILEIFVVLYVMGFICEETREIVREGIGSYLRNMWNIIDFTRNSLYMAVVMLRTVAYVQQRHEIMKDPALAFIPREHWDDFDPQLIAEGLFAAANVFSALKLVHLFSINPHLGPLQISLGRMVIDIVKFFFIYSLVLFAFACGLNQLLWYFADLEKQKCYHLPGGLADWVTNGEACMKWRRFGNLFESSQSLFWASFGMIGLDAFELTGIKSYTRFWGLLMFGSYSVINVIVLLNLLIAMMSNSYAAIVEHSDVEWKFARTRLWLSYFEESATLPPPFNIFPAPKHILKWLGMRKKDKIRKWSTRRKNHVEKERDYRYTAVMRALVWRYVAAMHRKLEDNPVTEDDISEIKSVINSMRCDIIEVLGKNGMDISEAETKDKLVLGKKMRVWERRLMKDFQVSPVAGEETEEELQSQPPENEEPLAKFKRLAKLAVLQSSSHKWGEVMRSVCQSSQIGRSCNRETFRNQQYLQRAMEEAQRLKDLKPKRGHSPTPSPIPITDPTRDGILSLIKEIREEVNPEEKWRPPSSNGDNNRLSVAGKSYGHSPRPGGQGLPGLSGSSSFAEALAQKRAEAAKEGRDLKSTLLATRDPSPTTRVVKGLQNSTADEAPKFQYDQKQNNSRYSEQRNDDPSPLPSRQDSTSALKVIKRKQQPQAPSPPKDKPSTDKITYPRPQSNNDLRQHAAPSHTTEPNPGATKQQQAVRHPKQTEEKQIFTDKSNQTGVKFNPTVETKSFESKPSKSSEPEKKYPAPQNTETKVAAPKVPSQKQLKPEIKTENKLGDKQTKSELVPILQVTECTPVVLPKFGSTEKLMPKNDNSTPEASPNLKAAQTVEGVSTIKRQPKSGWL